MTVGHNNVATDRTDAAPPGSPVAHYFPPSSGQYEVKTGLHPLGRDFGNGPADGRIFQLDTQFRDYRAAKLAARSERLDKYFQQLPQTGGLERRLVNLMIGALTREYPEAFVHHALPGGGAHLTCRPTGETLLIDVEGTLKGVESASADSDPVIPPYRCAMDALALQVQEDIALLAPGPDGRFRLSALHLCLPNHWAAEDKIGADFAATHAPVPDMGRINRSADALLTQIARGNGPYVRFSWGIGTDNRLNHHPVAPAGIEQTRWRGRSFDPAHPDAWLRVERQVLTGIGKGGVLFTIRTYHYPVSELITDHQKRTALIGAMRSMSKDALLYKGLDKDRDAFLTWLARGRPQ